jgi:hypothetical protein
MFIKLKKQYKCVGGPWHGESLRLRGDGATAVFEVFGWRGRYVQGQWEPK